MTQRRLIASALLLPLLGGPLAGQTPMGSAFTYQGRLADVGFPPTASYDFEFRLYDEPSAGTLLASQPVPNLPVVSGLFTVSLDFGASPFSGSMRFLEVAVKPAGSPNPYTVLAPRQVLAPTPYSIFSSQLPATYTSPIELTSPGNVFAGDGAGLTNLNPQAMFKRTRLVSPVGTPAQNGAALLAALAAIPSPSASDPWLLKLEPGVYELPAPTAASSLLMREWVDIEGSGETVTKITSPGSPNNDFGTVQAVNNTELRHLTVENTGGAFAKPLYVVGGGVSPRISHVTVVGRDATTETQGFFAYNGATPTVTDLTARVSTLTANSFGVLNVNASSLMTNVQSYATGGATAQAVWDCCGGASTYRNVVAIATGGVAENRGMSIVSTAPTLENVVAIGSGAAATNYGILNIGSAAPIMRFVSCRALGASVNNFGCHNSIGTHPTMVDVFGEGAGGSTAEGVRNDQAAAGLSLTRIRAVASGATSVNRGVFVSSCSPAITELEALAFGGGTSEAAGVSISNAAPTLTHVTASGSNSGTGNGVGIRVSGASAAPSISLTVASGTGGQTAAGVWSGGSARLTLRNATSSGSGGAGFSLGLFNQAGTQVSLTDVVASASTNSAATAYALWNQGASQVILKNVEASAGSSAGTSYGILNNSAAGLVTIERSTVSGDTASVQNAVASTVFIATSQLVGAFNNPGAGAIGCLFSYDGAFTALNAACQ
jgi:hypothetical protein